MLFALVAAVLLVPSAASAARVRVGNVFTETNATTANQVVVFDRFSDGTLAEAQRVNTGGVGAPSPFRCGLPPVVPPCPVTDSQGAVSLTPAGTLLFAVNAGSNTISSFRVSRGGVALVDQVDSGGRHPVSLDNHGHVLYVVNQETGNISGFEFTSGGEMTPIAGSSHPLVTPGLGGTAGQIGFDRTGRTLVVTEPMTNLIDTFVVTDGVAAAASSHPSSALGPFGFVFDRIGHLVVSDAGVPPRFEGNLSSYRQAPGGGLVAIQTLPAGGAAPCWVVITPSNRYVYVANLVTKSIARFRLAVDGKLTLLGVTHTLNVTPNPLAKDNADEALSRDGRYLYALVQGFYAGDVSRIDEYSVGSDGSLTLLGSTPETLAAGTSGLAAR